MASWLYAAGDGAMARWRSTTRARTRGRLRASRRVVSEPTLGAGGGREEARRLCLGPGTDDLAALRALGTVRTFARGQALMHQEQVPHSVLLLHSGRVKVSSIAATGGESVLAFRGPGDLVGELSALDAEPRSATVVAVECVEALVVADHQFRAFLAERPAAAMALLRVLAWRLRDSDAKRIQFAACTTPGRVAARLLELCWPYVRGERVRGAVVDGIVVGADLPAGSAHATQHRGP